jgi:nucleoside-diphosphate-sugar epimerase
MARIFLAGASGLIGQRLVPLAALAVARGSGIYNVAEPSPYASSERARRDLGWTPDFRL